MSIGAETVYRARADRFTDEQGNLTPQRDWSNATRDAVFPVSVQPAGTTETRDVSGVNARGDWRVYDRVSPVGFWRTGDRVEWGGTAYDIVGDPQVWPGPRGGVHHWEIALREQPLTQVDEAGLAGALRSETQGIANEAQPWTP